MDRISTYRQIRLEIAVTDRGPRGALFARICRGGRVQDRLLVRSLRLAPMPVDDLDGICRVLEATLADLRAGNGTPAR